MKIRGYTSPTIARLIKSVKHQNRFNNNKQRTNRNRPTYITRYTASSAKLIRIIRQHWHHIQNNPAVGNLFPNYPIMAFKKNKNLNYLIRAKLKPPSDQHLSQNSPVIKLQIEHQTISNFPEINLSCRPPDIISPCPIRSCFPHKYLKNH